MSKLLIQKGVLTANEQGMAVTPARQRLPAQHGLAKSMRLFHPSFTPRVLLGSSWVPSRGSPFAHRSAQAWVPYIFIFMELRESYRRVLTTGPISRSRIWVYIDGTLYAGAYGVGVSSRPLLRRRHDFQIFMERLRVCYIYDDRVKRDLYIVRRELY
jgi:hypothetical protein